MSVVDIETYRRAARRQIDIISTENICLDLPKNLEFKDVKLQVLVQSLRLDDAWGQKLETFESIIILETYLAKKPQSVQDDSSREIIASLQQWVSNVIRPTSAFAERSPYSTDQTPSLNVIQIAIFHSLSLHGIDLLSSLEKLSPLSKKEHVISIYACLASFSNLDDPWTCNAAHTAALSLIKEIRSRNDQPLLADILTGLLQRVKSSFAKSKNPAITQQARKAISPLPGGIKANDDTDTASKPWKYHDVYIPSILRWSLTKLPDVDNKFIESNWPLIVPPILALIDDVSTTHKAAGCTNLTLFLQTEPTAMLQRTGLGEVFEEAVMPALMYLPTLTEEAESIQLLSAAYPALIALAKVRFPEEEKDRTARVKALDCVMRQGILKGYAHAGENVKIADLLVKQMVLLVDEMGIDFVKHLKTVLPLLSANLSNPFATSYPPLLKTSTLALQSITLTAWPRMTYHRGEILKGLTVCWCSIANEEEKESKKPAELEVVKREIMRATKLLTRVLERECDVRGEYGMLVEADGRLGGLLKV